MSTLRIYLVSGNTIVVHADEIPYDLESLQFRILLKPQGSVSFERTIGDVDGEHTVIKYVINTNCVTHTELS